MTADSTKYKVLGIGNPLLDIQSPIDEEFLKKYEEMKKNKDVKYIAGGSTLNSIRVCQWVLKKSHPNCTAYMGCIGNDKNGEILKQYSAKDGVKTHFMVDEKTPTGICGVGIMDKERTLITHLAAANNFKLSHLG